MRRVVPHSVLKHKGRRKLVETARQKSRAMLTDRISIFHPPSHEPTPEDYFESALIGLFPDETRNQHGDPSSIIIYRSPRFGDIKLTVADPTGEDERKLFAHYLWNAGVFVADAVEVGEAKGDVWDVKGQRVLELGAGLGLSGIVSSFARAEETVISDYSAPALLKNIQHNVDTNLNSEALQSTHPRIHVPRIQGHIWGSLSDAFTTSHKAHFTRIIAADCLWMPWEHTNLALSTVHFLADEPGARVLVVAGFHTGRAKVASFFEVIEEVGLVVESIEEVDVEGRKREWRKQVAEGAEDVTERKRWLVVAVLKKQR